MWKIYSFRKIVYKPFNVRTVTILADGSEKNRNKILTSSIKFNFENLHSPVPFSQITKTNFKDYQFPTLSIRYNRDDVVEHAKSIGIQTGEKHADNYLNGTNKELQVAPSFIFPLTNKILMDMSLPKWMPYENTVHGEHYIKQIRPLPPEGVIHLKIKALDVLEKGQGALYCFNIDGYNENNEVYFKTENQTFEIGAGRFNGNKSNSLLTQIIELTNPSTPDAVMEFQTFKNLGKEMSDSDMEMSIYSSLHPRQRYSRMNSVPYPPVHGRWTFAVAIKLILFKYGNGNANNFKAAKVRYSNLVLPGDKVQISTWKDGSKILFQGDVQKNKKMTRVLTGGYVDLCE